MEDFDLTAYLANGSNGAADDREPQNVLAAQTSADAGQGDDFDLTAYLASAKATNAPKSAKSDNYGEMDRQRDTIIAETGEDIGKGEALARNLIPFFGDEYKSERSAQILQLEKLRDGSALADIRERRQQGRRGDEEAGERKNRNMVFSSINQSSIVGNSGFGAALAQIQHAKAQGKKSDEETYFDQIENVGKNAGIDRKTLAKLRESSATADEFANKLQGVAVGELKAYATRKKEAQKRLADNEAGTWDEIVNGLITNAGYQGKYIIAGMSGGIGLAGVAALSAEQRALALQNKEYDVDENGDLIVIHNDDSAGMAAVKGIAGGVTEVAVEQFLEKTLGLAYKGAKKIPGVGKVVGKVGDGVAKGVGKIVGGIGAKLSKNPAGKWLVGAAENFGRYQKYTGINGLPMEMLEEHVQDFADDVLGFNTKGREYTTFGNEAADWWHNKFWNADHNKDLFLGLVGTMALQGAYAGTKAHHDIAKWRQNRAGFLKTMLDEKQVDALSDTEVRHLYNFVTSPGFTKEKVDRFLGHVKDRTEMANALLSLKEANTPFFDSDQKAVDEAVSSGSVKSRFAPPTVDMNGGKKIDWQPYVWGDGQKTQRVYDNETGIAIDKLGGNRLCVTNRDGLRIVVDGETSGDSFARAISVADKMSIHNQILDAKRPAKEAYIKKRIEETAQNGKFVILKNNAELVKMFPELAKSADYTVNNPALKLSDGRIVLVTDNMKSAAEVNRMILHEAAIHAGLNKAFTTEQKRDFLSRLNDPEIEDYKARIDHQRKARGLAPIDWNKDEYVEEAFAHVWDRRRTNPLLTQKVSHLMRDIGRSLHLPISYNRSDIEVMVDTLQRDLRKPGGSLYVSGFDTTDHAQGVPYNEAQRDFSGDVADPNAPSGSTEGAIEVRNMQRNDRIAAAHPYLWQYAMRRFDNDEDAAADYVSERLEEEGRRGKAGEMDHAHHALLVAEKLERRDDLAPEDLEILDEHGFTGPILYSDYGYRKQKNGSWKFVGVKANVAHPELAPKKPAPRPTVPATAVPVKVVKSNRQQKAEHEQKFVESLKTKGGRIQRIPAASIKTGDGEIAQFKEDADPKTGIVPGNELEGEYDERTAGLPVVMRFEDGHYETVTGRHRIHLAQRQGIDINVMVLEHGEDGRPGTVSVAEAEAIDAKANIKDGKGSMKDYIKFFKHAKMTREEAEKEGLLGKKTQGRKAFALYNDATPELTGAVDFDGTADNDSRTITPEQAGIIAMNAPKDAHKLNGAVQRSMRDYVIAHPKANGYRLARLTQAKQRQLVQAEKNGQLKQNADGQGFLFADMAADVAATDKLDEIENYKEKRAAEYRKLANRIRDAKNSKTVIGGKSMGQVLQLSKDAARELDLIDEATGEVTADRKRLEDAAQLALGKAFLWTRMELPPALQDELDRDLKLGKYAARQDSQGQPNAEKPAVTKPAPKEEPKPAPKPEPKPTPKQTNKPAETEKPAPTSVPKPKSETSVPADEATHDAAPVVELYSIDEDEEADDNPDGESERAENNQPKAAKPSAEDAAYQAWLAKYRLKDTPKRRKEWEKKQAAKPKTAKVNMDRAKEAANNHVVTYGNGSRGTLANMIRSGIATLYPAEGIYSWDKGTPHVVTIGLDQFVPTKAELPYLIQVQREWYEKNPTTIDEEVIKRFPELKDAMPKDISQAEKPKAAKDETPKTIAEDEAARLFDAEVPTAINNAKFDDRAVDLGDATDEFTALAGQMWFSRDLEIDGDIREKQTALSGGTSRNQNPAGNEYGKKWGSFRRGTRNIDIGAGRFDKATQFLSDLGVENIPFDPVNRDSETNRRAAEGVRENPADTATVHNVLNVIDNDSVMDGIINQAARGIKKDGAAIFTVYEGDRSGNGKATRDGYQRNAKASAYVPHIAKYFGSVEAHGNVIIAREPKDIGPAFWAFDSSFDNGIRWFSRELEADAHTDEEKQAHNLMVGVKMVNLFASKGYKDFGQFARTFAKLAPDAYRAARNYVPGMWLTARITGAKINPIDENAALETLKAVDATLPTAEMPQNAPKPPSVASEDTGRTELHPTAKTRGERISAAADEIAALIADGTKFTRQTLEKIVGKHLGGSVAEGTFEMKDATDILELAVNRYMKDRGSLFSPSANVSAEQAVTVVNRIRAILDLIPTATTRSAKQEKMQQFSTPPHEAFMAAWVANVNPNDVSLEPSAGIGGIAVFSHLAGAKLILNELDADGRAKTLEQLGIAPKVYNFDAENLWSMFYPLVGKGEVRRPTVVVMNPPFSNSQRTDRKDTIGVGGKHIEEALQMLAPGGRLVAIVGHGMAHDAESPKVRAWWRKIGSQYQVRADVTVNGQEYAKYGTTYDNDLIVIDKVKPNAAKKPVFGIIQNIDELPSMLEGVRNDRPAITPENAQPTAVQQGGGGSAASNGSSPVKSGSAPHATGKRKTGSGKPGLPVGPVSGLGGSVSSPNGAGGKETVGGNGGKPGLDGGSERGGTDGVNNGSDSHDTAVQSPDAAVINAAGDGSANTEVREVGNGTFSEYRPSKVRVPGAKPHPTPLVESTAMASVLPPDPTYKPILPKKAIESGQPSEAQIEQIVYAGQAHEQFLANGDRRGYFIGDGTGLGKGTEISGIICDNYNHGRKKAVWVSKSSNLYSDAQRDLKTFGMESEVFEFDQKKKGNLGRSHGIAFMSYSGLAQDVGFDTNGNVVSSKKNKINRFQHLVNWLGKDFDGVIVFDECHKAGNAVATRGKRGMKKPSAAGRAVVALQQALPKARILYVSATGATEVSNLSYAVRLGLWGEGTAFRDREQFIEKVSSGGLSVMEIVARDMKSMGVYAARTLSYEGIVNRKLEHKLSESQTRKYDEFADAWQLVAENVKEALVSFGGAKNSSAVAAAMSAFWGGQQRFFNQVLTAMQMPSVLADAKKQLEAGNSVVFQLVNTNEATQERAIKAQQAKGEEVNPEELDLSPRDILIGFVEHSFPTAKYVEQTDADGNTAWVMLTDAEGKPVDDPIALEAKDELLTKLRMMKLDNNPLELLLDEFGVDNVAEITGRSRRRQPVRNEDGEVEIKLVRRTPATREAEIDEFNAGKRKVLVFSDAGGTGKSFHADRRFANQSKRVHYLVQAGWRADGALQGFGRTHRSNEKQPPEYVLCSTDIRGHQRFISTVARRLAQLGSLTAGDRASAGSGVFSEEDNLENQYASGAVKQLFNEMFLDDRGRFNIVCKQLGFVKPKMNKRTGEVEEINMLLDEHRDLDPSKIPDVPTFLNRILNCRVSVQNQLFDEFADKMKSTIEAAKDAGKYDPGLEKLQGDSIEELNRTEIWNSGEGTGSTDIVEVGVGKRTKKTPFESALRQMSARAQGRDYFFARNVKSGKVFGFAETNATRTDERGIVNTVYRCFAPDGKAINVLERDVRLDGDRMNFTRLPDGEAQKLWDDAVAALPEMQTTKRYFVHGTLLPIWDRLGASNPRIYRIAPTGANVSFLGMEIQPENVNDVIRRFGKTPQAVELTPAMVMSRIVQEGKAVRLQRDEWEIRRAKVNGDYRIELKGVESLKEMQKLEADGLGTIERISFTPRFFIPRTEESVAAFLKRYPAMPDDGGISSAQNAGPNYLAMTPEQRTAEFGKNLDAYVNAYNGAGEGLADKADQLQNVIVAMSNQELIRQAADFQQYDRHSETDPIHHMRMMIKRELVNRNALTDKEMAELTLWYSRDLELDDEYSAISIYEVNAWRKARGIPEIVNKQKTTVDRIVRAGKYMASNTDEIDRFINVSAQTPHGWTSVETNAVQQRRIELERDYDAKTDLINQAEMDGNKKQANAIREARKQVQDMIDTLDRANRAAAREWGLTGIARRFMLHRNGTFAKFTGDIRADIGRQLTPEEEAGAKMLWDAYRDAQGKLDELTIRKTSELLKDILRKHFQREAEGHKIGNAKVLRDIETDYQNAIDHLIVHANRSGGFLMNLPDGRKWIDAIRRYHMAAALETGRKLTVDETIDLIKNDLDGAGMVADRHDIMQVITGHGNTYEADNSELEKALREQRALMNEYQKWEDMMDEGHMPDKTGLIRDEPTQTLRDAQKITRDLMRDFMEKHPELLFQDASRRLKSVQDSLMKRWQNEIKELQDALDNEEKIMRVKGTVAYTPEMEAKKRELDAKRREYREMFPPEPLTHQQKLDRYLKVLQKHLADLEEKRTALENAKTDEERAKILGKRKGEKLTEQSVMDLKEMIANVREDIQDIHNLHFPAGTLEEFNAMVERRRRSLSKNLERIEAKLNARDFSPQKLEPSALAKRVANAPEIIEATRLRNAASKRLMQERERYKRSVLPYNAGRALDWAEALMAAPRVFRTMLDLSATMTQGAALFSAHPILGYQALENSVKAFYSEANTDTIMAALMSDPDFAEFVEMGGHVYNISNLDEKGLPEEFRGISQKLVTIRGKQYGLDDIPGVKASERSFGVFLNCLNVSLYKALKANGGWSPLGPSEAQKKDIAISLNVASGRGYENNGGRGAWDRVMSAVLWAPRFAASGFKMAVAWNIIAPQIRGDITERTYADRMVSSKQAAKEYARQIASMAAWTLLATLLLGRKDPEWLEEVLNPLSSNFLTARIGNTNISFFGSIKQWWTFLARFLTGKTVGMDGVTRNRDRGQTATRFIRGKLSPLAGLVVDLTEGKDFLGDKLVWDRAAQGREKSGWKHVGESLGVPLSAGDVVEAFKENSLANALLLTPFIVAGAAKSTYQLDEYARAVNPYKNLVKEYKAAQKEGNWTLIKQMRAENPILAHSSQIDNYLKRVALTKKQIQQIEKRGEKISDTLQKRYELEQQQAAELIRKFK